MASKKIRTVHIYDMDGCLVDSSWRYRTITSAEGIERIDFQHWRAMQHEAFHDALLPLHDQYIRDLMNPDTYVIVATAREMHEPDMRFLREKMGEPDYLVSRPHGSSISGATLKINGLAKFFNLKQFKHAEYVFYEDNVSYLKAVCDRFNIRGVYIPSVQGH